MTVEIKPRPQQEKLSYKDNTTKSVDIEQNHDLRGLIIKAHFDLAKGATGATGAIPDGYLNVMKKVRLVLGDDDNKFNVDAVKWFKREGIERANQADLSALPDPLTADLADQSVVLRADFANVIQDLSDITALLPASDLSRIPSLRLEVDWGSIKDLYGTPNDSVIAESSNISITLLEAIDTEGRSIEAQTPNGRYTDIREAVGFFNVKQGFTEFDSNELVETIQPSNKRIRTVMFLTREDAFNAAQASRLAKSDIITRFKIDDVKSDGVTILHWIAEDLRDFDKSEYGLTQGLPDGIYYIDFTEIIGGLDNFVAEGLKYKFLTNAPDGVEVDRIETYIRYEGGNS